MLVHVLNKDRSPLMPCQPVIARLLLKEGKARVKWRTPFIIQLACQLAEPRVQQLSGGLDPGSGTFGVAVTVKRTGEVLYLSQVTLRNDITTKMTRRRSYRRNRRQRKTRYRPKRFNNRKASRRTGRLSPTVRSKLHAHEKELEFVQQLLPVKTGDFVIESCNFDIAALTNPAVLRVPWLYQRGPRYGHENVKAFIRARDRYRCQACKGKSKCPRLECHHIIPRKKGGSDTPDNLILLCETCHEDLHAGKTRLSPRTMAAALKRRPVAAATQMNVIRSQILKKHPVLEETTGYVTKIDRLSQGLPKTHYLDAAVIAARGVPLSFKQSWILFKRRVPDGDYQQRKGKCSEITVPRGKIHGFRKFDKVHYRGREGFIKGRMSSGYAVLMDIHGQKLDSGHVPLLRQMKRVSARATWLTAAEPLTLPSPPDRGLPVRPPFTPRTPGGNLAA